MQRAIAHTLVGVWGKGILFSLSLQVFGTNFARPPSLKGRDESRFYVTKPTERAVSLSPIPYPVR